MTAADLTVRAVPLDAIVDLRHRVLRPGLPRTTAVFPGDDQPTAFHFAAVYVGGTVVGCATFHPSEIDGEPAWQLRGMATDPAWAGRGVGRRVLDAGVAGVTAADRRPLWCNARKVAVGFYQRLGWAVCSDEFDIAVAGPHYRMRRDAPARAGS